LFKLKKLELLGFKSFADRTRLELGEGTAGIVGPNGCGKSNLADAISWVLGEQSARLLRGERMADVIFNGTGTRPPTGMAEVSLALIDPEYEQAGGGGHEAIPESLPCPDPDTAATPATATEAPGPGNGNGSGPAAPRSLPKSRAGEMMVTRRLFRSGESEYLINGETCRLRDIQDLFMGTGLGPESYAIIEQGRIGQILSSKPSDRRAIIEEAAGVSKFKTRKRLAEAKLESSRQNLARITDILEEVTKQVNSLKRQASKARRYRELQAELRSRLKIVLSSKLKTLEAECECRRGELAAIEAACSEAAQRLEEVEREQKAAALRHEQVQSRLTELRAQIAQGDLERERFESRLEQARQQTANLEARITDASRESTEVNSQLGSLEQQAAERARQGTELQEELAAAQATAAQLMARQEELTARAERAENEVEACRQAAIEAVSHAAELRNQLVQAEENGLALDRQAKRAQAEKAGIEQEQERLAGALNALTGEERREAAKLGDLAMRASDTAAQLEQARTQEGARREELAKLRDDLSRAAARKQALEESLARHAYSTESVRRLLSRNPSTNGDNFRPLGVLADFVEVTPGYEEVVEEFLKRELDGVVVARHSEARSGIALLRSEGTGRSTFFVTQIASNGHANSHQALRAPGVVARLRDLVRFEERLGLNGDLAFPRLENAYVVEDDATGERLASEYPEYHFLTRSGEHYHHRLVSGGKGSISGPLALRRDFRELERRLSEFETRILDVETALANDAARATQLEAEWRGLAAAKTEADKGLALASEKLRQTRQDCDRTAERLRVLQSEVTTLETEGKTVRIRQETLRAQLAAAAAQHALRENEITRAAGLLRDLRGQLDQAAQEIIEAQARTSALEERRLACEAERQRLAAQAQEVRARFERLAELVAGWREEQGQLAKETESVRAGLTELEAAQSLAREQWRSLEQESHAVRARRDELGPQVDAARFELESRREKRSEAGVALARAESDHAHHVQQCREELNAEPAKLLADLTAETTLAGDALQAAEAELAELKARLENLGPVNMMALEELQEAEERFTFLETQRQDLLASIQDTSQAIREIDQVSRQQFLEAFKAINAYFAESFRTLFGGGVGEMRLADETDPESGLDIVAQPPGKRLQNVLLLSGGEKALAALALLIAVFRYTPSPFCVLDEVDAPLDESNLERFTRMIEQMSRHTQFILITHNKRTMEMARLLYGVTMEEPGVSKLVSVRFDALEPRPLAPTAKRTISRPAVFDQTGTSQKLPA
jgi:chromosome segregation protein